MINHFANMLDITSMRGISALLALSVLAPSIALAQDGSAAGAAATEPVVETTTTVAPVPTNVNVRPTRIEMGREIGAPKPQEGRPFGEPSSQVPPPGKSMVAGKIIPTTTQPLRDPMIRRASGTPPISPAVRQQLQGREGLASGTPQGERLRERMDSARERMAEARKEQMKEFVRKTIARMRAAIERLSKLADRIDSRMEKLRAARENANNASSTGSGELGNRLCTKCTEVARQKIDEAKAALAEAEAGFASYVPPTGESATGTPTRPQPGMGQPSPMREQLKKAEVAIREAHKALTEAIASMRILPTVNKASDDSGQ